MPALSGTLDKNATEYSQTVMSKAADMAQAVNNLRLKIMKALWLTVSTQHCKTQELFRAITVVQDCNRRNCSIRRQIYTSLVKPTQQSLCVAYPSKKPLFQNKPHAKICLFHLSRTIKFCSPFTSESLQFYLNNQQPASLGRVID